MKDETNLQIAGRIAIEAVTRYLPDESPDVGRGRRCLEFLESQIKAALDDRDERAAKIANERAKELRRMATATLLDKETVAQFKYASTVSDELADAIRGSKD